MNINEGLRRLGLLTTAIWLLGISFVASYEYISAHQRSCRDSTSCSYFFWRWSGYYYSNADSNINRHEEPIYKVVFEEPQTVPSTNIAKGNVEETQAKSDNPYLAIIDDDLSLGDVLREAKKDFYEVLVPRWESFLIGLLLIPTIFWLFAKSLRWVMRGFNAQT